MFELEAGLMRSELKQEQDELGNALPDDLIKGASIVTGLINAGLEYFGFASVAKTFGAGKVTGKIIRGKIKDLVKDEGSKTFINKNRQGLCQRSYYRINNRSNAGNC